MLRGLTASVILHAGIIASSLIVLPYARDPIDVIEVVPIDIVSISETNVAEIKERITDLPPPEEPAPQPEEPSLEEFLEDLEDLPIEQEVEAEEAPPPPEQEEAPEDIVPEAPEEKEPEPEEEEPEPEPDKDNAPKRDALDELFADNVFQSEAKPLLDRAPQQLKRAESAPPPVLPLSLIHI